VQCGSHKDGVGDERGNLSAIAIWGGVRRTYSRIRSKASLPLSDLLKQIKESCARPSNVWNARAQWTNEGGRALARKMGSGILVFSD